MSSASPAADLVPAPAARSATLPRRGPAASAGGSQAGEARAATWTEPGTGPYRRISAALFLAGFSTFSLIYAVQPLLPGLVDEFGISPSASSLALSLTTGFLAFSILCAGAVSETVSRRGLMFGSMTGAALLHIGSALAPSWHAVLALRALEGILLGGVPAVAMAYLAEEIHPRALGAAMGLYVGGTAFGGMMGRVGIGILAEFASWRTALGVLGAVDLAAALGFFVLLPASRNVVRRRGVSLVHHRDAWLKHLRNPGLPLLFAIGFLVLGAYVSTFNYLTFRLTAAPYGFSQGQISAIFTVFLFGVAASTLAGSLADRLGRGPVLIAGVLTMAAGTALTCLAALGGIFAGIVAVTAGFFIAHAVASGWVGRMAQGSKGHAASLYLLAYYLGSSLMGSAGGWFWSAAGWPAVAGFNAGLLALALALALRLNRIEKRSVSAPA
ncbi:MFS transporter [Methylobacterium oxalidis]|uniref:MFS transporter n=1 Tax=Methylobacterium oxalidis TaxID=944322 RepID=A0A512IZL2_9HYPH|nr:MFS transporter [Methylobacterium oxalidis]GEP03142.1 MFS transporter [Methylobacterium oxalidis]GJE31479.1 Inner membrane transport protein YnfM [Methylobacterium oxalidis]GLS67401.1 MFS transporter [Methylobacterium oxalidis]